MRRTRLYVCIFLIFICVMFCICRNPASVFSEGLSIGPHDGDRSVEPSAARGGEPTSSECATLQAVAITVAGWKRGDPPNLYLGGVGVEVQGDLLGGVVPVVGVNDACDYLVANTVGFSEVVFDGGDRFSYESYTYCLRESAEYWMQREPGSERARAAWLSAVAMDFDGRDEVDFARFGEVLSSLAQSSDEVVLEEVRRWTWGMLEAVGEPPAGVVESLRRRGHWGFWEDMVLQNYRIQRVEIEGGDGYTMFARSEHAWRAACAPFMFADDPDRPEPCAAYFSMLEYFAETHPDARHQPAKAAVRACVGQLGIKGKYRCSVLREMGGVGEAICQSPVASEEDVKRMAAAIDGCAGLHDRMSECSQYTLNFTIGRGVSTWTTECGRCGW